jgi:F-type H+-transporting ATPase subunit gamma
LYPVRAAAHILFRGKVSPAGLGHRDIKAEAPVFHRAECAPYFLRNLIVIELGEERVHARLTDAGLPPIGLFTVPNSVQAITPLIGEIQIESEAHRAEGEYAQLYVFHNRPQSGALYETVSQRLLPLDGAWAQSLAKVPWPTKTLPQVMGGGTATLRALIREYLFISLFRACAESLASENASRLAAMQRADKNIDDLMEHLHGTFHRLRQSGIDEELFDVISGFEALKAHEK